jgi:23S rRNA U2552 (ribose-2'-O)-methylase RlmE/FtsJ
VVVPIDTVLLLATEALLARLTRQTVTDQRATVAVAFTVDEVPLLAVLALVLIHALLTLDNEVTAAQTLTLVRVVVRTAGCAVVLGEAAKTVRENTATDALAIIRVVLPL